MPNRPGGLVGMSRYGISFTLGIKVPEDCAHKGQGGLRGQELEEGDH